MKNNVRTYHQLRMPPMHVGSHFDQRLFTSHIHGRCDSEMPQSVRADTMIIVEMSKRLSLHLEISTVVFPYFLSVDLIAV